MIKMNPILHLSYFLFIYFFNHCFLIKLLETDYPHVLARRGVRSLRLIVRRPAINAAATSHVVSRAGTWTSTPQDWTAILTASCRGCSMSGTSIQR